MTWGDISGALEVVAVVVVAGLCLYWGQNLFQKSVVGPIDNKPGTTPPRLLYAKLLPAVLFALYGGAILALVTWKAVLPQHASPVAAQVDTPAKS